MLEAMRRLALAHLWVELDGAKHPDPEEWYRELRKKDLGRLFPKLVEDVEDTSADGKEAARYYTLSADRSSADVAILETHEFRPGDSAKLPFNQPSGSQSAALGPVVKRTSPSKAKDAGPSGKIRKTTLGAFDAIAGEGQPWSGYFRQAAECFNRPTLRFKSGDVESPTGAFHAAVQAIDEKRTVLLAFRDEAGRLPGEVPEYVDYLQEVLARTKYSTGGNVPVSDRCCALCGAKKATVYPNALKGAGINLANIDRDGAFPGLDPAAAWKGFPVCVACADLLYVYWNHIASDFVATIAGERALVIADVALESSKQKEFAKRLTDLSRGIDQAGSGLSLKEHQLLKLLANDKAVTTLTLLWAEFGQRIDDVKGVVADVLPSRLNKLIGLNHTFANKLCEAFPDVPLEEFDYDLSLRMLRPLLRRPGGKKAQAMNDSRRLFDLRRDIVEAVYHRTKLPARFWDEVHLTAQWHWDEVLAQGDAWNLLNEGFSKKKNVGYLTLAGWVRQLARFLAYLRHVGVIMQPIKDIYQPNFEPLKPYFTEDTAIDCKDKAFAFILGVLYGKLLSVQAARKVNVSANALTWLRRLSLSGQDIPEFYKKVIGKIIQYNKVSANPGVIAIREELAELGTKAHHQLDTTKTCYFLLLGASLASKILPSQPKEEEGDDE